MSLIEKLGLGDRAKPKKNRAQRRADEKWKRGAVLRNRKERIARATAISKAIRRGSIERRHEANRVRSAKRRELKKVD